MPGQRASRSHLHLIVMPQRRSVLRGIGIGHQDGYQARVFSNLTRPKSQPKISHIFRAQLQKQPDAWSEGVSLHLHLIVMPQRCFGFFGIGMGGQDGCQARVFSNLIL